MKRNKLYILPLILSLFWGLTSCEDDSSIESAGTEASVSGITLKLSMPRFRGFTCRGRTGRRGTQ